MTEPTVAELLQRIEALEKKAHRAQSYVDISNLQRSYGYYVDKSLFDEAADLFSADASLEIAGRGYFKGRERLREYLRMLPRYEYGSLFTHMQLQPVIHVADDGATAKGRWRVFIQIGWLGKEARWGEGIYENEYVFEDNVWKIAKLHFYTTYYIEFDQGWNKGGIPLAGQLPGSKPDKVTTVEYGAFPDVFIPPFHYDHPVTGAPFRGSTKPSG